MSRKIILVGDRTSHSGVVLQGSHSMVIGGKNVALIGDMVSCPQCKGNYPIAEGSSRMRENGRGVALEGMKTACGAELIASQSSVSADE